MKESPQYVRLSLAAAMQLNYLPGRFYRGARMTCINLLLTYRGGCAGNCAYCGLARERETENDTKSFIRVPWPVKPFDEVVGRIAQNKVVRRACISMITHKRSVADTGAMARRIVEDARQPVSVLVAPGILSKTDLVEFQRCGVDKIGVAFDLPTSGLFEKHRGQGVEGPHRWKRYWETFEQSIEVFGEKMVGSHFIVGLGETEKEMVEAFQRVKDLGGGNHLFSFYPEQGSELAGRPQPDIARYRRIQIACELIDSGVSQARKFSFDSDGRITDFGVPKEKLEALIDSGKPFQTRGCLGIDGEVACNRPYANSLPGEEIRNFPFSPDQEDIKAIRQQMERK